jgi:hypothetical protein
MRAPSLYGTSVRLMLVLGVSWLALSPALSGNPVKAQTVPAPTKIDDCPSRR